MNVTYTCGFYDRWQNYYHVEADLNVSFDYYKELKELLHIKSLKDYAITRTGKRDADGGYIMADDFRGGIAYSFGICDDVSWDTNMAEYGYDIFMYDHTIPGLPYRRDGFHFYREGISGINEPDLPLKTLKYYMSRNNHTDKEHMILKMDVEGAEWDFLDTADTDTLNRFDQILFEYHELLRPKRSEQILRALKKINETHQLIHLHANNSGDILKLGNSLFPSVLEATYVNKKTYQTCEPHSLNLPLSIDVRNDIGRPEIALGNWNEPLTEED